MGRAMTMTVLALLAGSSLAAQDEPWGDHRPVISPDGSRLAFMSSRSGTWSIYLMGLDGGEGPRRVSDHPAGEWYPHWSPDGARLVYHRYGEGGSSALRLYDVRAGREAPLGPQDGDRHHAEWAPDGASVLYTCGDALCRMTLDGVEQRPAFPTFRGTTALSPDGLWTAYADMGDDGTGSVYLRRIDGSERTRMGPGAGATYGFAFSPDGRFVAYNTAVGDNVDIHLYEISTGRVSRVTTHPAQEHLATWAPDGSYLVFTSEREDGERIYRADPDGRNLRRVDTGG